MFDEGKYSSTLTGAAFLFFEIRQVIKLKQQLLTDAEIKAKVRAENLFQYNSRMRSNRCLPSIIRRMNVLDEFLRQLLIDETLEIGKAINLYAILKTDSLFFEFMNQIIRAKLEANDYFLEKKELNLFFTIMAEQDTTIAGWSEQNIAKLKQTYIKILHETGIIKDTKTGELNRLNLDQSLKEHWIAIGDIAIVRAMGE